MPAAKQYKKEADVKDAVKKLLSKHKNVFWYMPVQTGYGVRGIPDFVVCLNGKFIGIETKFGGNTLSAWQAKQGAAIEAAKGVFLVIDEKNIDVLDAVLHLESLEPANANRPERCT